MFKLTRIADSILWRLILTFWCPLAFAIVVSNVIVGFGLWAFLICIAWILIANLLWEVLIDWCDLYRNAMGVADQSIKLMPLNGKGFVNLSLHREIPPRLLWVVIVHDHSTRVYMGWHWFSRREPNYFKAISPGVRRKQVA